MAEVNIAGYRVSANPTAPNSLFECNGGGGTPAEPEKYIETVTLTETDDAFIFKETDGAGEERTIGTILKIDNGLYLGGVTIDEEDGSYIFTAETVSGEKKEIGRVEKTPEVSFIRPTSSGSLRKIEEAVGESYLDFTGTNGAALRLPLIYMGEYADPGENLVQGLTTGSDHGANGERNTFLLVRSENGLYYLYTLPDGGAVGQVLAKRSAKSYDYEWKDAGNPIITIDEGSLPVSGVFERISISYGGEPVVRVITDEGDFGSFGTVPGGGSAGQILRKRSDGDYDTEWAAPEGSSIFEIEEVSQITAANCCSADVTVSSPDGVSSARILNGTSLSFTGENQYAVQRFTSSRPGKVSFKLNPFGVTSEKTEHVFTMEKVRYLSTTCFKIPLNCEAVSFYTDPENEESALTPYRKELEFEVRFGTGKNPSYFINGDQFLTGPGATPTLYAMQSISSGSIDPTASGLSISNIRFYNVREVTQ